MIIKRGEIIICRSPEYGLFPMPKINAWIRDTKERMVLFKNGKAIALMKLKEEKNVWERINTGFA
ncbi:hypothetical protein LCGC14_0641750 [marine sediment metagenome]|uniref:Uncharacterized protein n=1 Tax=marine sediment metagenome TaxID=412755 RepID=A0A0F9RIE9_9ZZZZ|nr:hypothetical protein [Candidatus Aminicenantes bacterium]